MHRVLHISASPRGEQSESMALAGAVLDGIRSIHSDAQIEHWDLWDGSLPPFGSDYAHAKMAIFAGREPTGRLAEAWSTVGRTFDRFSAADDYVFSVPMWNAGVPYVLKQLIDVVSQPGLIFDFHPDTGYTGLLKGKRAVVAYTSAVYGPDRPPSFGADFQSSYFADWLHWAGVRDVRSVEFRPNVAIADADRRRREAHRRAAEVGRAFALDAVGPRRDAA